MAGRGVTDLAPGSAPQAAQDDDAQGVHRFTVGALHCTAISDGHMEGPVRLLTPETPEAELKSFLASEGEDVERRRTPINVLHVQPPGGDGLLVDSGHGVLPGPAGVPIPTTGRTLQALAAAGIGRETVRTVLVSHLHPDHIGGVFDVDGRPAFPNARYHVSREEATFWGQPEPDLGGTLLPPHMRVNVARAAREFLGRAGDRLVLFGSGEAVTDGVTSVPLPGHTPGQVGFLFDGGDETLFYSADAIVHARIAVQRPDWRSAFDAQSDTAIATRKRVIAMTLDAGWRLFTPHFPWPGVGRLVRGGEGARWVAEP